MNDGDEVGTSLELHGGGASLVELEAGVASQAAREESEVKAAVVLARNFPRDEQAAFVAMQRSARRPTFALGALYSFPRGGRAITGPSVKMAREMARCWGNLQHGIRLLSMDQDYVHVEGWAWDLQTNTRVGSEAKFKRLVQRKQGGQTVWQEPDERDLRELVNKHGAVCVRNSILQLMAPDVVDELERMCLATNQKAAEGDIEEDRDQVLRSLAAAFANIGVTTKMLEQYVGHALEVITPAELVDLRAVFTALRDGTADRGAYFDLPGGGAQSTKASKLEQKLADAHAKEAMEKSAAENPSGAGGAKTKAPAAGNVDLVARAKAAREKATQEQQAAAEQPDPARAEAQAQEAAGDEAPREYETVKGDSTLYVEKDQAEPEEYDMPASPTVQRLRDEAEAKGPEADDDDEVRVIDGNWVGAFPNLKDDLPRILSKIEDPQVLVNMAMTDGRVKGRPLYATRLCEFALLPVLKLIPTDGFGDDLIIEMLCIDEREGSENRLVASLKARGIDIADGTEL
tara:strand:+ start:1993 stop:3543 length:1551 start_codon:yes stop_codon:yes gene_type:complete